MGESISWLVKGFFIVGCVLFLRWLASVGP